MNFRLTLFFISFSLYSLIAQEHDGNHLVSVTLDQPMEITNDYSLNAHKLVAQKTILYSSTNYNNNLKIRIQKQTSQRNDRWNIVAQLGTLFFALIFGLFIVFKLK